MNLDQLKEEARTDLAISNQEDLASESLTNQKIKSKIRRRRRTSREKKRRVKNFLPPAEVSNVKLKKNVWVKNIFFIFFAADKIYLKSL